MDTTPLEDGVPFLSIATMPVVLGAQSGLCIVAEAPRDAAGGGGAVEALFSYSADGRDAAFRIAVAADADDRDTLVAALCASAPARADGRSRDADTFRLVCQFLAEMDAILASSAEAVAAGIRLAGQESAAAAPELRGMCARICRVLGANPEHLRALAIHKGG